jgi:hypothetical protein
MGQIGYTFLNAPWAPRFMMEYSFASGDSQSGDGRSSRYDQLFARAHRIWGILDQVGGRNSKIWQQSAQFHPAAGWQLRLDHLSYWLANPNDDLYRHNGRLFLQIAPGNTATHIGEEVEGQITWRPAPEITIGAGFGKLFSGSAVKSNSRGGSPLLGYIFAELEL